MRRLITFVAVLLLLPPLTAHSQMSYSTGAVRDYVANGCGGPDLPLTISEADNFRAWEVVTLSTSTSIRVTAFARIHRRPPVATSSPYAVRTAGQTRPRSELLRGGAMAVDG